MTNGPCGIAVMAKASRPGRTKTRLVPPLTYEEAADLNTVFLRDAFAMTVMPQQASLIGVSLRNSSVEEIS